MSHDGMASVKFIAIEALYLMYINFSL